MKVRRFTQAALVLGVALFLMAASASAVNITFSTNAAGTQFTSGGLSLASSGGAAATLVFTPNLGTTIGVPSNVDLGDFLITCPNCTTQTNGGGAHFSAFTFDMIVTDSTDGATGMFVGTSAGGTIFSDSSGINVIWAPLQLGTGANNALTGNFGPTSFVITNPTQIVALNSGTPPGDTTVQGFINTNSVPEPATLALLGFGLLGLGMVYRKRAWRQ